jgi:hypothetical protein
MRSFETNYHTQAETGKVRLPPPPPFAIFPLITFLFFSHVESRAMQNIPLLLRKALHHRLAGPNLRSGSLLLRSL